MSTEDQRLHPQSPDRAASDNEHAAGRKLRVGVGDARAEEAAVALVTTLRRQPEVVEVVRYEVGPSVVVHTGVGTVGACFFTAP